MEQKEPIASVDQALAALKVVRRAIVANAKLQTRSKLTTRKVTRRTPVRKGMSEEGRLRIAEAQRKRWAVSKRAAKKAARLAARSN